MGFQGPCRPCVCFKAVDTGAEDSHLLHCASLSECIMKGGAAPAACIAHRVCQLTGTSLEGTADLCAWECSLSCTGTHSRQPPSFPG